MKHRLLNSLGIFFLWSALSHAGEAPQPYRFVEPDEVKVELSENDQSLVVSVIHDLGYQVKNGPVQALKEDQAKLKAFLTAAKKEGKLISVFSKPYDSEKDITGIFVTEERDPRVVRLLNEITELRKRISDLEKQVHDQSITNRMRKDLTPTGPQTGTNEQKLSPSTTAGSAK